MRSTLILVAITCLAYLFFSSFSFFIPNQAIFDYGFSFSNWLGAIAHPLLHISPVHLISNMALLLAVGFVVEKKLNWKEYYLVYFLSAIVAAIVFGSMTDNVVLAGASAAITGFILPACFIDFKKTIFYIIVFSLAAAVISAPIESAILASYSQSQETSLALEKSHSEAVERKTELSQNMSELDDKFKKGEINITEYNETKQELEETLEKAAATEQEVSQELNETTSALSRLEEGIVREQNSTTSALVHFAGSFAGFAYLALFRRDIIWESGYQVLRLERWLKKRLKKSKRRTSRRSSR